MIDELKQQIACSWQTRYHRERRARRAAEDLAEAGLRELYTNKRLLELLGKIAIKANEVNSIEDALAFALKHICETIGWQVGHAYVATGNPTVLAPTALWHGGDGPRYEDFREATERLWFRPQEGLPGRVLASGAPVWISDVSASDNFPRAPIAKICGLTAAFAFPVMAGSEVAAVLEFFLELPHDPDEHLLRLMAQIGTQLGRVVERKRAEEQLLHDASHDALTRLPNRSLLIDRMSRAIARQQRHPDTKFATLFIDLDRFKIVNDSMGHNTGDELILDVAARFSSTLRQADVLSRTGDPERGTLARLGGDEFVVLLEDLHNTAEAAKVAQRLQEALEQPFTIRNAQIFVSASIGIASSDSGYSRAEDMLRDADMAMYRAKSSGKARYQVFDSRMHKEAIRRLEMESSLRKALERREMRLHYMPIVTMDDGEWCGFEALLRWERPEEGLVAPGEFIGIAEDTGLIIPIGNWVLREACTTLKRWQRKIPGCSQLTMNVNLSPRQFAHPSLVEEVRQVLEETGVDPALLKLEITESCMMEDSERAIVVMTQLRALGVQISLDDFGTGFSSLSYLHRFPLHQLKIDRSFVNRMAEDEESLAIVRMIVRLARDLHLQVTAEGPTTREQVTTLQAMACDYAQGFFFSEPLPESEAEAMLVAQHRQSAAA